LQNQGSIGPATVAELLQTMQQDRATGTLLLENGSRQCSLHFLFGHLFHATGEGEEGEGAVMTALGWNSGAYTFNPRAKLPPEETINSSTDDLLRQWERQDGRAPGADDLEAAVPEPVAAGSASGWPEQAEADDVEVADIEPFTAPPPPTPYAPPVRQPPPPAAAAPARAAVPTATAPLRRPPVPTPPVPAARPPAGATRAQLSVMVPMPSGPTLHAGLKASFLNFPMLLKTLSQDGFSGYVSVTGETDRQRRGDILFKDGEILQSQQRGEGNYRRGKQAIQELVAHVGRGQGLIDAVELPPELVASVAPLIVATTVFINLPARIVDFQSLIEFIADQRVSGGILVSHGEQVAVALLGEGTPSGSYSTQAPELAEGPQVAAAACAEREARIDVVASPPQPSPAIDLAEIG
jgi:hypothetical protein